jgi:enterochelin esterase-like enzyme
MAACGGGGAPGSVPGDAPVASQGTFHSTSIASRLADTTYPLSIYLPPASAGPRHELPVVYALDGESWYATLAAIAQSTSTPAIVVAVHSAGQRNRDFVPTGSCTSGGGGHAKYLDFIRQELIPHIEASVGGAPAKRILFGHSHGGSFVLYALFAEAPAQHSFKTYLASDASIPCFPATAYQWEQVYASAHSSLPVRLQLSYATGGNYQSNFEYAQAITQRKYSGLLFSSQVYLGSHIGIVPQALADGMAFALGGAP